MKEILFYNRNLRNASVGIDKLADDVKALIFGGTGKVQVDMSYRIGGIDSTGYIDATNNKVSQEMQFAQNAKSVVIKNPYNTEIKYALYKLGTSGNTIITSGYATDMGMVFEPAQGGIYVLRLAPISGQITDIPGSHLPTVEYSVGQDTLGYHRRFTNITGLLTWENKEISTSGIVANNDRLLAKMPNAGNIEVRGNRPLGKISVWKKSGNTITCLYQPDYYGYRYTGDYESEYYAMLQPEEGVTLSYPFASVFSYDDEGKRYGRHIPQAMLAKKIAFFGDSIVQGYNKDNDTGVLAMYKPWASLVAEESASDNYTNYGIGGALVYDNNWKSCARNASKIIGYDIVFVCAGTNDYGNKVATADFTSAFSSMLDTLITNNTKVVVMTPVRRTSEASNPPMTFDGYCEKEIEIAVSKSCDVIETHVLTNSAEFKSCLLDNLHPNERGHRIIADIVLDWMSNYSE